MRNTIYQMHHIFFFLHFSLANLSISHVSNTLKKYVTGILDQGMMSLRSAIFSSRFVNAPLNEVFALEPNNHRFFFKSHSVKKEWIWSQLNLAHMGNFILTSEVQFRTLRVETVKKQKPVSNDTTLYCWILDLPRKRWH